MCLCFCAETMGARGTRHWARRAADRECGSVRCRAQKAAALGSPGSTVISLKTSICLHRQRPRSSRWVLKEPGTMQAQVNTTSSRLATCTDPLLCMLLRLCVHASPTTFPSMPCRINHNSGSAQLPVQLCRKTRAHVSRRHVHETPVPPPTAHMPRPFSGSTWLRLPRA